MPNAAYGVNGVNGGLAEYEVATILGRQVWEAKYEPVDPTQFSGMKFDPTNYIGELSTTTTTNCALEHKSQQT
ncbi:MAG: hypothetical protein ACKODK_02145, partial [Opitutaceae bacterium]